MPGSTAREILKIPPARVTHLETVGQQQGRVRLGPAWRADHWVSLDVIPCEAEGLATLWVPKIVRGDFRKFCEVEAMVTLGLG